MKYNLLLAALLVGTGTSLAAVRFLGSGVQSASTASLADQEVPTGAQLNGLTVKSHVSKDQNTRSYMEDTHNVEHVSVRGKNYDLFGVYDGHGGDAVSKYLRANLPKRFAEVMGQTGLVDTGLEVSLARMEQEIYDQDKLASIGSTAVVAVLDKSSNTLHVANVGDSRAIVIRNGQVIFFTTDHKPNEPTEKARIERVGEKVYCYGGWRIGPLAVSRTIGDCAYKGIYKAMPLAIVQEGAIIATPDISHITIEKGDRLVMASDGLWDVFENEEVAQLGHLSAEGLAEHLKNQALAKGSHDNITVVVANFS